VFGRVSTAAVAKLKATAVVAACATAGSFGGAVALRHVAPVRHESAPAGHRPTPGTSVESSPASQPSAGPSHTDPSKIPARTHSTNRPTPARSPVAPSTPDRPAAANQPDADPTHSAATKSHSRTTTTPESTPSPEATPSTPVSSPAPTDCGDGNHGDEVSPVATGSDPGDERGSAVQSVAHDDCGTGQPTHAAGPVPDQQGNGHGKG
jgi:hypothetical protein